MGKQQRSILLFRNSIKSKVTFDQYLYYVEKFKNYYKLRDLDSILSMDSKQLQIMIEDYVMELSKNHSRSSVANPFYALEAFLDINDVMLNWRKIRRLLPAQGKKRGKHAWTTKEIQDILSYARGDRSKALIHFLASSGVRIGAVCDMKIRNITNMPDNCRAVCVYEDDNEEYHTFLTPEASNALQAYLDQRKKDGEHLSPESPLFRQSYTIGISPAKHMTNDTIQMIIYRILRRMKKRGENENKRNDIAIHHGFRKRFNTILKTTPGMNNNLAEKMMGHSTTIPLDDAYLDASLEKMFAEFKKAIPELTIDGTARKQAELDQANQEKTELEKTNKTLLEMQKQNDLMWQDYLAKQQSCKS